MSEPITVAIERQVDPTKQRYALSWVRQGIDLAHTYPGFLGSGWVQVRPGSDTWHMLYRFDDAANLHAWEASDERRLWLDAGADFAREASVERRSGIEGWFDSAAGEGVPGDRVEVRAAEPVPPRWKQGVVVWLGFFPVNVVVTLLLGLIPGFADVPVVLRLLVTSLVLTPIMVGFVLPAVTRLFRPWLLRGRD